MKKIIIDTDPGIGALGADIDDGLAIVMALNSEKLQVLGLTTVNGNVTCDQGTINALNLLEVMNRKEVPVCKGADRPLVGDMKFVRETFAEILDRAGWKEPLPVKASTLQPRPEHAVDFIIDQVCRYPGEVTMVCIGPLTNLALAIRKMPQLPELIHETIIMGGGWTQPLDCITPVAEFNMFCDPEAAKIVLHSGMPLYMTGYELCKKTQLKPEHLAILGQRQTPTSQFIARMAEPWLAFMKAAYGLNLCFLPDPQAIALAIDPGLFTIEAMYIDIETKGELTRGMTVADRNQALHKCPYPPNVHVCTDIHVERFMELLLGLLK
ncbi:MAG TPA: nucleoside hydrolase [Bacillota bacterium]